MYFSFFTAILFVTIGSFGDGFSINVQPQMLPTLKLFGESKQQQSPQQRGIIICADSSGVTAQRTLKCAFNQFDSTSGEGLSVYNNMLNDQSNDVVVSTFTHVGNEETAAMVVSRARETDSLLLYTLSDPEIRAKTKKMCGLLEVPCVDLMGSLLDGLGDFLGESPIGTPGKERVNR